MSEVLAKDTILSYIGSEIESKASSVSIRAINERGREAVEKTAFPTKKDEDWRFINQGKG